MTDIDNIIIDPKNKPRQLITILLYGETGAGKTKFVQTLIPNFRMNYENKENPGMSQVDSQGNRNKVTHIYFDKEVVSAEFKSKITFHIIELRGISKKFTLNDAKKFINNFSDIDYIIWLIPSGRADEEDPVYNIKNWFNLDKGIKIMMTKTDLRQGIPMSDAELALLTTVTGVNGINIEMVNQFDIGYRIRLLEILDQIFLDFHLADINGDHNNIILKDSCSVM